MSNLNSAVPEEQTGAFEETGNTEELIDAADNAGQTVSEGVEDEAVQSEVSEKTGLVADRVEGQKDSESTEVTEQEDVRADAGSSEKEDFQAVAEPSEKEDFQAVAEPSEKEDVQSDAEPSEKEDVQAVAEPSEKQDAQAGKGADEVISAEDDASGGKPSDDRQSPEAGINYAALSKEDLVSILREIVGSKPVESIIDDIENIKINFYKKFKADIDKKRKSFIAMGGELEEFVAEEDPLEHEVKELLHRYKELKSEYNKVLEEQKVKNLELKYAIIENIKELVTRKESINKTFQDFRDLQRHWREVGPVPQQNVKDMWENYHHHVEAFYDFIKINQELRDLDLKRNFEAKIELCEKAEELLLNPNSVDAFKKLQELHEQWREIGPVPRDVRAEIWDRFKEATAKINRKHQDFFIDLKTEQKKNLEAKTALCEKAEEYVNIEIKSHKEWTDYSNELMELQKVWKTIGFAPKKDNVRIYKRFRDACDAFFNRKREFYSSVKEEQGNNLQLKTELCIQAEVLCESTDWKKTMDDLISLQKRWKEIGPVPNKYSEKLWRRFRAACDKFFENKSRFYSEIDNSFENNFLKKQELIRQIEEFTITDNAEECLKKLKVFQRQWTEIGYVPIKEKDIIHEKYRQAINSKFDQLRIDDGKKDMLKFRTRIDSYLDKPNGIQRVRMEREKYISRLKQLENDIVLWENNIGFFARSRNAESMIKEVEAKIENSKKDIEILNRKISIIDDLED